MADAQGMAETLRATTGVQDADRALEAGLRVLGARLGGGADELAAQLPAPLDGVVRGGAGPDAPPADEQEMARAVAERCGIAEAEALDVLQGTMRVVAGVADRGLLVRLAAELPAALKPAWDVPEDADRFRTAQTDAPGTPLRAQR